MRLVGWLQVAGVVVLGDCVCSVGHFLGSVNSQNPNFSWSFWSLL